MSEPATRPLYLDDPYRKSANARVLGHTPDGGVILDASLFYPRGGGQPGDSGALSWDGGQLEIATAIKGEGGAIVLMPEAQGRLPPVGVVVGQRLDWDRRYAHMRMHTALHLLSVVIPLPVTGGAVGVGKGRLDFDMPDAPGDKAELEAALNALAARDLPVSDSWITDAALARAPDLVKTMSVTPPTGSGHVRLVRIGQGAEQVDLQPCGGTHVAWTSEIGPLQISKVEKKGRQNRRVTVLLDP